MTRRPQPATARLGFQVCALLLGICLLTFGWYAVYSRHRLIAETSRHLAHVGQIVAGQLDERLRLLDHIIQQIGDLYLTQNRAGHLNAAKLKTILASPAADIDDIVHVIGIVSNVGITELSSRAGPSLRPYTGDRTYFRQHRDAGDPALLSGPILSRSDNLPTIYITRRLDDPDGRFAGVVFASINPADFARDLARIGLPAGSQSRLVTPSGTAIVQDPPHAPEVRLTHGDAPAFPFPTNCQSRLPKPVATQIADGALRYHLALDCVPLALDVSVPEPAVLAPWYQEIRAFGAVIGLVAIGLTVIMAGLHRQLRINDAVTARLALTRERLEAAQSLAQLGSWRWDPGRRGIALGGPCARLLGLDPDAKLDRVAPRRLWLAIHPDDRPLAHAAWRRLVQGGPPQHLELRLIDATGETRWMIVDARAMGRSVFGTVLDISDRHRNEEERRRWADAFQNAAHGIAITDARRGTQLAVNPAYAAMHLMTVPELTGAPVTNLYPASTLEKRRIATETSDRTGHAEFDTPRLRKDGSCFPARVALTTVHDAAGEPLYRIATVIDLSERREIEQQLVQAQKMEAVGNLTGGIAHDFNNLLGIMVVSLDSLGLLVKGQPQVEALATECLTAALNGAELTQRLLAFSRNQPLALAQISVTTLITDTVALLRRVLGDNITIMLDLEHDTWPIFADPIQLETSLVNLTTNARDAMPAGGHIMVATRNRTLDQDSRGLGQPLRPGDYVVIEVTDTGNGMTPEVKDRIFEPFFTTKERGRGTGLGLSMVFGFVRQSGGVVTVDSDVGKGSQFSLFLPRAHAGAESQRVADPQSAHSGQHETVLVVEDNEALRKAVAEQLRGLGYHALTATDAAAALQTLSAHPVDLLLTDLNLPGEMGGEALGRCVAISWPRTRVMFTSGFAEASPGNVATEPSATSRFLRKPFRRQALARMVREALDAPPQSWVSPASAAANQAVS